MEIKLIWQNNCLFILRLLAPFTLCVGYAVCVINFFNPYIHFLVKMKMYMYCYDGNIILE